MIFFTVNITNSDNHSQTKYEEKPLGLERFSEDAFKYNLLTEEFVNKVKVNKESIPSSICSKGYSYKEVINVPELKRMFKDTLSFTVVFCEIKDYVDWVVNIDDNGDYIYSLAIDKERLFDDWAKRGYPTDWERWQLDNPSEF